MQPAAGRFVFGIAGCEHDSGEDPMLKQPQQKYRAFAPVALKDRTWPDAQLTRAPLWCSVDLRDGNQALIEPMDSARKLRMFEMIVRTFESLRGARRAIVHVYNACSPVMREVVLGLDKDGIVELATSHARLI